MDHRSGDRAHAGPRGAARRLSAVRIGLDVTAMHVDRGGSAAHVRGLWQALSEAAGDVVALSCPGAKPPAMPRQWRDRLATVRRDIGWSLAGVERAARRAGVTLLHVPVPIGPSWGGLPLVVTVHDLFVLTHPRRFRRWHRTYSAATIPPLLRRARAVITVSPHTRDAVLERFGLDAARVHVVPNGVPDVFRPRPAEDPVVVAARQACGLPPRYVMSVGQLEPRKNLERLVAAARLARTALGARDLVVVHAGPPGWGDSAHAVPRAAAASGGAFRLLGALEESTLAALVAGATALAYPSLGEGFGLPVAEAMASGTAVLTTHAGALRDVAGDDAEIVNPTSVEAIADGLVRLWGDDAHRRRLAARGLARADRWRWPAVADATRAVYDWAWRHG
ncbi:MAG: glycosyltransferase family 4 protein [Gemmatimonadota bacterium]